MNRQIRFRGKTATTGAWIYGHYVEHPCGAAFIVRYASSGDPEWHEVKPDTVGVWTGLRDNADKPIFEGDIVEMVSYCTNPRDRVFARTNGIVEFYGRDVVAVRDEARYYIENFLENVTVVGNIFDNPDLMENNPKTEQI